MLIPITIEEKVEGTQPTTITQVEKPDHLKETTTIVEHQITPAESQDILANFISAAEQEAQECPLTIDDDYLDIFDEEQIESPYEPVSISGRKTPEVIYTPTSIVKSEDKSVSQRGSTAQQESTLELEKRGILPVPITREPSTPREFDSSDLPPREIIIKATKTEAQRRKEYKQRRKQRGFSTQNPGVELPGRPNQRGKIDRDARWLIDYNKDRKVAREKQRQIDRQKGARDLFESTEKPRGSKSSTRHKLEHKKSSSKTSREL
uniref:Uncharacterized protein n=1 Tax=Trichogramma kaykai TaxID=54128 RepID=A0ABD2W776_9HYME